MCRVETPLMKKSMENETYVHKAVHPSKDYEDMASFTDKMRGIVYILSLFVAVLSVGYLVVIPAMLLLSFLCPDLTLHLYRILLGLFCSFSSGILEYLCKMEVIVTAEDGEEFKFKESDRVLLISNHRTEIDWLLHWNFATKINRHDRIMTMLKSALRKVPLFGGILGIFKFPFVERNWTEDQSKLTELLSSYRSRPYGTWLAMFPEGTALYERTLNESQNFQKERNKPVTQYVLQPRLKGFALCVSEFQPDYILDMTMAFPELRDGIRPSPLRLLNGLFPKAVHFYVRRHTMDDIMAAESPEEWLQQRFEAKEKLLSSFYQKPSGSTFDKKIMSLPDTRSKLYIAMAIVVVSACTFTYVLQTIPYSYTYLAIVIGILHAKSKK